MPDRSLFTPDGSNPPFPVPVNDLCTVPTEEMAVLLAELLIGERDSSKMDVLEIGTGSGYQSAILAERCRSVVSVDIVRFPGVAEKLPENVAMIVANGYEFNTGEEFEGILVTFRALRLSGAWMNQLKDGARLVVPLACGDSSRITVYQKCGKGLVMLDVAGYAAFTAGAEA